MLDGRIARPPSWSLDPGSPFGGPGPGRVGAGCCHGCRPTGVAGVAGGGRAHESAVAGGGASASRCGALCPPFMSYANPRGVGRPGGGQHEPGGPRSGPGCPDSLSGRDIRRRSRMPCQWPRPIDPGQGYGGLRMTWSAPVGTQCWPRGRSRATSPSPSCWIGGTWTMPTRARRRRWCRGCAERVQMLNEYRCLTAAAAPR